MPKVSPELYSVSLDNTSWLSGDNKEQEFNKKQERFKKVDFITCLPYDPEESYTHKLFEESTLVVSKDQIVELSLAGIKFDIKQKIDVSVDITQQLLDLAEKPIKIMTEGEGTVYNNKCEVHMAGNMLALYNEMLLLSDACTDELQTSLNSGWRIVAACNQPDQRRPDYILGRFNPEFDGDGSAKRKGDL